MIIHQATPWEGINTSSTWEWYERWSVGGMAMERWGFLDDIACLLVKDRVSVVVSTNIKLYRPLAGNGGDKPSNWLRPSYWWNWQGGWRWLGMSRTLTEHPVKPFVGHLGRVRERLNHRDIPSVPMGLLGDIPYFRVGLTCTPLQSIKDWKQ